MWNKKKIEQLEKRVSELESILNSTCKFVGKYLKEQNVDLSLDHLFSIDSPIEDFYCFIKNVDDRLKRLEIKKTTKRTKKKKVESI